MASRVRALQARLLPHGPVHLVRQVLMFWAAYYAYRLVRGVADDPGVAAAAFQHARDVIGVERTLHVFVEPSVQALVSAWSPLSDAASWLYLNAQTSVTVGGLAYIYLFHNRAFPFVRNMFVVAMAIALVGYLVVPTAPPRLMPEWGFSDPVAELTHVDPNAATGISRMFNPYAAIPSMHVCFALMLGLSLRRLCRRRAARIFWGAYPAVVLFVVVGTANHFLADAVLGAATAWLAAQTASLLGRLPAARRAPAAA